MNLLKPLTGWIRKNQRERRDRQARDEAYRLDQEGKFAAAAAIYTPIAGEYAEENPLIYQLYAHDSFAMWLKAKDPQNAVRQAGDVLRLLCDTGWITRSDDAVDDLSKMVGELYVAGYQAEAAALSAEVNRQLAAHGLKPRAAPAGETNAGAEPDAGRLPSTCPQCGGTLPAADNTADLTCPYCGTIIRAKA